MTQKTNISLSKKGMNRTTNPSQLEQQEYVFALNSNMEDLGGETFLLTNEHSNILANKFKAGFRVVGFKNDINLNRTFFFLTNINTNISEFGYIINKNNLQDLSDIEVQCNDCDFKNVLLEPLENQTQTPYQEYVTLLSDCQDNKCFNFSINYPIKKIEIKNEKNNTLIVFTDNYNPPRYIQLDNLGIYSYIGEEVCLEDNTEEVCLACDKMKIFKDFSIPQLTPENIILGGRLRMGTYQFLIAYSDGIGNEISEYYSITNLIRIFDQNNSTLRQENLADRTNFSIKLSVSGLDKNYTHYKIAVIQTADINNAVSYFVEGIHPINDNTIIYSGEENKDRIDFSKLIKQNIFVKKWEGLTQSNNYLFGYGIEVEKEVNLQPVVSLLGQFFKWQASIAPEDLYKDGIGGTNFIGYNRDEVVPLGIRFYGTEGYRTSIYNLPARLAEESDLIEVLSSNKDRMSIENSLTNCISEGRTKRWQFYNDAIEEGYCNFIDIPTVEVQENIEKICYIPDIAISENGTFTIELNEEYTGLSDYIEDNKDNCPEAFGESNLCELLDLSNYPQECNEGLFEDNCEDSELISSEIQVVPGSIIGETFQGIEKVFPDDYSKLKKPEQCLLYATNFETGAPDNDLAFKFMYMYRSTNPISENRTYYNILIREYNFVNESCQTADGIQNLTSGSNAVQGYFHNYIGDLTLAGLQTSKNATCTPSANWTNKIHKGALWFKGFVNNRTSFLLEVSNLKNLGDKDDNVTAFWNPLQEVRVSIFNKCSSTEPLHCEVFSMLNTGLQYRIEIVTGGFTINDGTTTQFISEPNLFPGGNFYVAIDNPIYQVTGVDEWVAPGDEQNNPLVTKYRTVPTDGCFGIATRDIEFSAVVISWESIKFRKKSTYSSLCTYQQPVVQKCTAIPYKYGKFAYSESQETYPDNEELYNSKLLTITENDLSEEFRGIFESSFVESINSEGEYILKDSTNLTCKPIRHFRFPDNKVSPFMYENAQAPFNQSIIYPLGITINENIINELLDIAVKNNLITKERRDSLIKYEIVRGDISNDRSIQASGLLYDIRTYKENNKDVLYPNYPFNDLGVDKLNLDSVQESIEENDRFTFHSPETDYYRPTLPGEMSVQGYMFGKSRGVIDEVKNHPKWVILSSKAKNLAGFLAGLEVASEIAVKISQSAEVWRFSGGFVFSGNPVGVGFNIAVSALATAEGIVASYGRYRYEWLKIFRDLGQPQNFAYYYYAEGNYNYLKTLQEEGEKIRGLNVIKKLKSNQSIIVDETTGDRMTVNNTDREESIFLSTGDYPIVYDNEYKNYDNNTVDFNNSSITFASENNQCTSGKSPDIIRNVASPYVALKNFIPSQYGTVNSIKWIPTGYTGDLSKPKSSCVSIFGGDTFISRHTLKRKIPLFLTDSMNQASLTPFNYSFYSNIGRNPRFFADYEINKDFDRNSSLFPDLDSDFSFDCYNRQGNYVTLPSKFYLYYYGIPNFLCETRINTNYRYGQPELDKSFYPDVGDIGEWTQQTNVSIKSPNYYYYNDVYSKSGVGLGFRTLPDNYSKYIFDIAYDKPNGVMYSLPDNEENNLNEPWLIYRPFDFYEFPTSYGKLKDLRGIESNQVLGRFENQTAIFNSVDVTVETGQRVENNDFGNGGIFVRRPVTFSETDLGYAGSQTTQMVSSEYGHFFADAKRGHVFRLNTGGKGIEEISSYIGGKPSGMSHWFKEHLPFKILKYVDNVDTDNALNGVGLTMGWDSRFKRVFLTKRDYVPAIICEDNSCLTENLVVNGTFDENLDGWSSSFENQFIWRDGKAWFAESQDISPTLEQSVLEIGKTYTVTFDLYLDPRPIGQTKWAKVHVGTNSTEEITQLGNSRQSFEMVCTGNNIFGIQLGYFYPNGFDATRSLSIDNVCVMEKNSVNNVSPEDKNCIPKENCIEFIEGVGFVYNQTKCDGIPQNITCPEGYTYEEDTQLCVAESYSSSCPQGFTYNQETGECEKESEDCVGGLDLVFVLDSTNSQQGAIDSIKTSIQNDILPTIIDKFGENYRLGLISVEGNQGVGQKLFKVLQKMESNNIVAFQNKLDTIIAQGGGGIYEPTDLALRAVLDNTPDLDSTGQVVGDLTTGIFRPSAAKVIVLTTDAAPSGFDDDYDYSDWENADSVAEDSFSRGIQIFSYLTINTNSIGESIPPIPPDTPPNYIYVLENYAEKTNGQYSFQPFGIGVGNALVENITNNVNCSTVPSFCNPGCVQIGSLCLCDDYVEPILKDAVIPISIEDKKYFKDVSWTIAFSTILNSWLSYYDFKPNYYINHNLYFQTGVNLYTDNSEFGLWSHLLTNKSYQVFYGKKYDFNIEYPDKSVFATRTLNNVNLWTEARRYHNSYDYAVSPEITFNKANIYNNITNSGTLNLIPQKNNLVFNKNYPKTNLDNTQDILVSNKDNFEWSFDYIYNRVKSNVNNEPNWFWDINQIKKEINSKAVSFKGKKVLDYMKGDYFLISLSYNKDSRYKLSHKFSTQDYNI